MVLSGKYVLRAIELRVKTTCIVGTLCEVKDPIAIHEAMKYFDIWNSGRYISNPYAELPQYIFDNMDENLFDIYIEYLHHWTPPCTANEIQSTIYLCNKFGYSLTRHKDYITMRRIKPYARTNCGGPGNCTIH